MKLIQKRMLPGPGMSSFESLPAGAKVIGVGWDGAQPVMYLEAHEWGSGSVYWEIKVVREGESYGDGFEVIGMFDAPGTTPDFPQKLFVVGRING